MLWAKFRTDPGLKDQVVIIGGHLDSWHSGTGATDNGAGCIVNDGGNAHPENTQRAAKRTIRIAPVVAKNRGLYGSFGYVKNTTAIQRHGALKPGNNCASAYYNLG